MPRAAADAVAPSTADEFASIELTAVLVAVTDQEPRVLTIQDGNALPSGPFASEHPTLQQGLRSWVERQTRHPLGYLEQLYTFADRNRAHSEAGGRMISISYLGLTRETHTAGEGRPRWHSWYRHFPWEDWRDGPPKLIARTLMPALRRWAADTPDASARHERTQRVYATFVADERSWNEELVLQRYELLYEAGLVPEARRRKEAAELLPGAPMAHDHRRILATGIARLRAKIKYRPIVFELMPAEFTLLQLQRAVEALAGRGLHKQNFRRLVDQQGLVEETGNISTASGGRPAKLFRFRRDVLRQRAVFGTKLPLSHSA